jgi:hypothetical protein
MKKIDTQYGIEITKPFSKQMYEHNDKVAEEMKANIVKQWNALIHKIDPETDWENFGDDENVVKLQKGICYSGFGGGYTLGDVDEEVQREIDMMQNWQLHEEYAYLCFKGLVPRTKYGMVGFGWSKMDYWTAFEEDMANC